MAELSGNGFIALPGGLGTLDEIHTMTLFNQVGPYEPESSEVLSRVSAQVSESACPHTQRYVVSDWEWLTKATVKGAYHDLDGCHKTLVESGFMKRKSKDSVSFVEIKVGQTDRSGETAISHLKEWHKEVHLT